MDHVVIKDAPLSADEARTLAADPQCGAISLFLGQYANEVINII